MVNNLETTLLEYIQSIDDGSHYPICGFVPEEIYISGKIHSRWIYNGKELTISHPPFSEGEAYQFYIIWKECNFQKTLKNKTNNKTSDINYMDMPYIEWPIKKYVVSDAGISW